MKINMISFEQVVNELADVKKPYQAKVQFITDNELNVDDLSDVVNYMTIERNFYRRRSNVLEKGDNK